MGKERRIVQWSFSRWKCYDTCPRKAQYIYIDGMREPTNAKMQRGTDIHLLAQNYVEKKLTKPPSELKHFAKQFQELRKINGVQCELEWGFNRKWEPCGWSESQTWARIKTDTLAPVSFDELKIIDYKTGQIYDDNVKQTGLYALAGFLMFPMVERITTQLWYLDQAATIEHKFVRDELPDIVNCWEERLRPMFNDRQFPAKPNPFCRNCFFRKENQGPCEF